MSRNEYKAKDIQVLEGLEPVRMRPGMYIGGKDNAALHHLIKEVFDNSMDEVISGHADRISVTLKKNNTVEIEDNGRGIPTDKHPKYKDKSALELVASVIKVNFSGLNSPMKMEIKESIIKMKITN